MSVALDAVVPLASTLLGAGITYGVNVRQRRRNYVEDLVNTAIAAVTVAEVSVDYQATVHPPQYMHPDDFESYQRWLVTEGMKAWATNVAEANRALARVAPYRPEIEALLPFTPDSQHRGTDKAIVAALRAGA